MTGLAAFRLATFVALALGLVLGLAACGVISTLVEGWKYAKAVEADLESATGVKPSVGFKWENGRLLTVTVAYPQLYEKKPLAALAEIVRRSVETYFKQKPEDIELSFSLGRSGSGTVAELQRRRRGQWRVASSQWLLASPLAGVIARHANGSGPKSPARHASRARAGRT